MIQRNFRRCRLKSCIKVCAAEYRRLQTIKRKREERIKQDYINSSKKSGNFPRTKKDFDMLFAQIATWKEGEVSNHFAGLQSSSQIQLKLTRHGESPRSSAAHRALSRSKRCSRKKFNCSTALRSGEWRSKKKCKAPAKTACSRSKVKRSSGSATKVSTDRLAGLSSALLTLPIVRLVDPQTHSSRWIP